MQKIINKAKPIRLVIFDIDGVFTAGQLFYSDSGNWIKAFHAQDGIGVKLLQAVDITIGIITSHQSDLITSRMKDLGVQYVYQGCKQKMPAYLELLEKLQLQDEQVCYVGDDLPDIPLLARAGFSVSVTNAVPLVKQYANYETRAAGGQGAVREVCELILQAQGKYEQAVAPYLPAGETIA